MGLEVIGFRGMPDRLAVESVIEIAWNRQQLQHYGPVRGFGHEWPWEASFGQPRRFS